MSGHLGLNLSWSGGDDHHGQHFRGSVPVPVEDRDWLTKYYGRGKVSGPETPSLWNPFAPIIYATHPELIKQKIQEVRNETLLKDNRYTYNSINQVKRLLANAGIPDRVVPWAAAQVVFETGNFTSKVSKEDFNLSGIRWINKPYQHATRGRYASSDGGGYFAHYASYADWAADFKRILSYGGNAAPIYATSLRDYVNRLYARHYFTSNPDRYYLGLAGILNLHEQADAGQKKELQDNIKKQGHPGGEKKKGWPWWGYALAGVGGLIVLKKVMD